jgi:DNA-directed RNA polymerase specialized sigma24 family protein
MTKKNKNKNNNIYEEYGVTEEDFLKVLDNISKRLAYKFKFGYHDFDDMKQQAAIFAIEGLQKYDQKRPLENFLWTHVRNRLFNYKRNNYQRPDKPCLSCPLYDKHCSSSKSQCLQYSNKNDCELYASWSNRNENKKNIMKPKSIHHDDENNDTPIPDKYDTNLLLQNQEIINFLDDHIVIAEYREIYLKLKHGVKVNKPLLDKLKSHISLLMKDYSCPKNEDN